MRGPRLQVVTVKEILHGTLDAKQVHVRGWLQNKRTGGGIIFLQLRDGSGVIQCTLRKGKVDEKIFEEFQSARIESSVELRGDVRPDPRAPGGREIQVVDGRVVHPALEEFPIAKQFHGPEFLLDKRHLFVRSDTTLFEVKYFDQKAYLTQSWQLYAEALIASVGNIYTVAPSFRAEKSRTRRHLTEYWHVEAEAPWCDLNCIIEVEEQLLSHIVATLVEECKTELAMFERKLEDLEKVKPPFERVTYDQAFKMIGEEKSGIKWGDDLGYEQEKLLTVKFDRPFFVTHYPKKAKAFYHMPDPSNPDVTLSVDCLAPEGYGEITGGGQRIEEYDALLARIREEGLDPKSYEWYLDLRKFGSVTHSGFGLGLERVVSWVCKLDHIRDAIAFPRLINRIYP